MKKVLLLLAVLLLGGALFAADLLQGLKPRQVRVSNKGKVRVLAEKGKTVLEIAGTPTSSPHRSDGQNGRDEGGQDPKYPGGSLPPKQ